MKDFLENPYLDKAWKYDIVLNYYKLVDSKNIEEYRELYELYSEISIYNRSWIRYFWKKKIINFFEKRFNILNIRHNILNIEFFENWNIFVEWTFNWKKEWNIIFGSFIDRFKINNNKIIFRKTDLIVDSENSWIIQID